MNIRTSLLALGLVMVPVVASAQDKYDGYLCCNMRTDGSWISDSNYAEGGKRIIPAGTPVKVTGYGRSRVNVVIDGGKQAIGNDYSRDLKMDEFARRYVVGEDPVAKIAAWPAKIQDAVKRSRLTPGMTREQVLTSFGYPISSENPNLDENLWRYWLSSFDEVQVHFGANGKLTEITADPGTRNRIWVP